MRILITVIILIFIGYSCSKNEKLASEHFTKAKKYFENNEIVKASLEIDSAIFLDTLNYEYTLLKAKIYSKSNQYEDAIELLTSPLTSNFKPDTVNYLIGASYYNLGCFYSNQNNNERNEIDSYMKSIEYFNSTIKLNPEYFLAYIYKSHAFHNIENYEEALISLNNALTIFPDSMNLVCYRGVEKFALGDLKGALIDLNKSIESGKMDSLDMSSAYRYKGLVLADLNKLNEAINSMTKALTYYDTNEFLFANRADLYRRVGQKDKACADYRKAAELGMVSIYEVIKEYCN